MSVTYDLRAARRRSRVRRISLAGSAIAAVLLCISVLADEVGPSARPELVAARPSGGVGALVPLHGEITDVTTTSLKRRIEQAQAQGANLIVIELNTPGGLVSSTIDIDDEIRGLTDIKTVAWVNPSAYSGGTAVALACDEIVMSRSSRMGDAQVIFGGPEGPAGIPEELKPKVNTPVLDEFFQSARMNGYSEVLVEAFVIPEREVWWLENTQTGERRFVFREEKEELLGTRGLFSNEDGSSAGEWALVESYFDLVLDRDVDFRQPIVRSDLLLQMSAGQAYAFGFSKAVINTDEELKARYDLSELMRIDQNWAEALARWLTSAYVRGFLMVIIMLGAYVEFHTPGVGVAGLVALIALGIFVGAPYATGLANIWEVLLIITGVVLIGLELFVIPGFGVAGISGLLLVVVGLLATFVQDVPGKPFPFAMPDTTWILEGVQVGLATLGGSLVVSLAGMVMLSKLLPQTHAFRLLAPANPTPSDVQVIDDLYGVAMPGDRGVTIGPLRPAGKARFGSKLVDVVSEGDFIDERTAVEVIEHRTNRVVVRKAPEA